jgi:hypothetical protein
MLMKFKNKMMMALEKMCLESEKLGGIPKEIIVTREEAREIMIEYNELKLEKILPYNYLHIAISGGNMPVTFFMKATKFESKDLNRLIDKWSEREIEVAYKFKGDKRIPLRIIVNV